MLTLSFNELVTLLSYRIADEYKRRQRRLLIAIDGPDCAGKTTLCRSLVAELKGRHAVMAIHFDDYLNRRAQRERLGLFSVEAFLNTFFDSEALIRGVLEPMRAEIVGVTSAPSLVLVEGLFLFKADLVSFFDVRIRLEIDDALLLRRALARDPGQLGSRGWVEQHYTKQCLPAQRQYVRENRPAAAAHCCVTVLGDDEYEICC